ncbi:MAG: sulfatase-like hydrolase/transferase [Luteitalea sp.]|nr:sulfatase-like hydrolase/transferase [Luteitalea sp.]
MRTLAATLLVLLAACGGQAPPRAEARPPNIVLIMTDDQGWAQLGVHGDDVLKTPNLDRLASESVELTRFYVSPVCAPTRASLMTGRYNYRTGVVDTWLGRAMMHPDEVTLAEMLSAAGYHTGIFGKWHLGDNYPMRPIDQGFDEALVHRGGGIGQPSDPPGSSYFDPILQHNGVQEQHEGYCTDVFFDAALRFIEQTRDRPYFLYLATNAPHAPYQVPDEYRKRYAALGLDDKDARIYGMITNIDDNVGRLVAALERLGDAEDTVLIFMTDNGPTTRRYAAGLRAQKSSVYEGGIRVPFFLRWPARLEPRKMDVMAAHIDVTPTLLDAAGAAKPARVQLDGRSLMPLVDGRTNDWPERTLYIQSHRGDEPQRNRAFAAVSQRWKLTQPLSFSEPPPANAPLELYDLAADPAEEHNLASAHPELIQKMKQGYDEWFEDVSPSRGYAPPKIHIGTAHENPVWLTRQDWRVVGEDGWGDGSLGYWEVDVRTPGRYDIHFHFDAQETPGRAELALGDAKRRIAFRQGDQEVVFEDVELAAGPGTLEARLRRGDKIEGVWFVEVQK